MVTTQNVPVEVVQKIVEAVKKFREQFQILELFLDTLKPLVEMGLSFSSDIEAKIRDIFEIEEALCVDDTSIKIGRLTAVTLGIPSLIKQIKRRIEDVLKCEATMIMLESRIKETRFGTAGLFSQFGAFRRFAISGDAKLEILLEMFLNLLRMIKEAEQKEISSMEKPEDRVRAVLYNAPAPARTRDRKAGRREQDRTRRNAMKGSSSGGGKKMVGR